MPELPEVEAFKHYFHTHALNKLIADITVSDKSVLHASTSEFKKVLKGNMFVSSQRMGKYLVVKLKKTDKKLVVHFGLTGSLAYTKNLDQKVRFSRIDFIFKDHSVMHWTDVRKFGKVWLVDDLKSVKSIAHLGIDALVITKKQFLELLEKSKTQNIKALLMDQSKVAGIGNEYADEILFQSGIDPHHKIKDLSQKDREKIYQQITKVLRYAIKIQVKNSTLLSKSALL